MALPVYQQYDFKSSSLEEVHALLHQDLNLSHPVVLNLKGLDSDQQREIIGLVENFFVSSNVSFSFPYPVYLISDHEPSITNVPLLNDLRALPKFFRKREAKTNVRESQLIDRNKLLQQEVRNSDASSASEELRNYAETHKKIYELERERRFYRFLLNRLTRVKNG